MQIGVGFAFESNLGIGKRYGLPVHAMIFEATKLMNIAIWSIAKTKVFFFCLSEIN